MSNGGLQVCVNQGIPGPPGPQGPPAGSPIATETFYLASYGSDANDGLSTDEPFATLAHAVAVAKQTWGAITISVNPDSAPILVPGEIAWGAHDWLNASLTILMNGRTFYGSEDGSRPHDCLKPAYGAVVRVENGYMHSFDTPGTAVYGATITFIDVNIRNVRKGIASSGFGFFSASGGDWDGRDLAGVTVPDSIGFNAAIDASGFLTQTAPFAGLRVHDFDRGGTVHECCSLHLDDMWIDRCRIGLELSRGAGSPNMIPIKITNCEIGILNRGERELLISPNLSGFVTTGTVTPIVNTCAGVWQSTDDLNYDPRPVRQLRSTLNTSVLTGSTAEALLWAIGRFVAAWGPARERDTTELRLRGRCPDPGLIGTATLKLKCGATTLFSVALPTGNALWGIDVFLSHIDATNIRGIARCEFVDDATIGTPTFKVIEIGSATLLSAAADTDFSLTYQLSSTSGQIQLTQGNVRSTIPGFLQHSGVLL